MEDTRRNDYFPQHLSIALSHFGLRTIENPAGASSQIAAAPPEVAE